MGRPKPLLTALRAAQYSLERERLQPRAVRRIRRRIATELGRGTPRQRWFPYATFVAGAVLVMAFLSWRSWQARTSHEEPGQDVAAASSLSQPHGVDCKWHRSPRLEMQGACTLELRQPPLDLQTLEGSRVNVDGFEVSVLAGNAMFDIRPVPDGQTVRVHVPGGEIRVVGTRFRVVVTESGGRVELYEGKIEFFDTAGNVTPLRAGQSLTFGTAEPPSPPSPASSAPNAEEPPLVIDEAPALSRSRAPSDDSTSATEQYRLRSRSRAADETAPSDSREPEPEPSSRDARRLIEQVATLRARGEFRAAAGLLESALERAWDRRTAEVLSYELGSILERHLSDRHRACTHWQAHLERFAEGSYAHAVHRARARMKCESEADEQGVQ